MDFKTAPVEIRKRRSKQLRQENPFNVSDVTGARSKFNFINLTKTKLKIVDHTGHSWEALPERNVYQDDYNGNLVVNEKLFYRDLSDLRNYVSCSKKSLDFENLPHDSLVRQKLEFLQLLAEGKKIVSSMGSFWERNAPHWNGNIYSVNVPHVFPEEMFTSDDPLVLSELGVTVYKSNYDGRCINLVGASPMGVNEALKILARNKVSVKAIEIIAKPGEISDKYTRNMGEVTRITSKQDPDRAPGIYITRVEPDDNGQMCLRSPVRHSLDGNLHELDLFSSIEEATINPRVRELQLERELAEVKRSANLEKVNIDLSSLKAKHESEMVQLKEKGKSEKQKRKAEKEKAKEDERRLQKEIEFKYRAHDIEREKQQLDRDRAMMQHQMDMRNYDRKDQSEGLKSTLGIAAGVVSALGIGLGLFKLFKS